MYVLYDYITCRFYMIILHVCLIRLDFIASNAAYCPFSSYIEKVAGKIKP